MIKICENLNRGEYRYKFPKLESRNIQLWFKNHRAKLKRLKSTPSNAPSTPSNATSSGNNNSNRKGNSQSSSYPLNSKSPLINNNEFENNDEANEDEDEYGDYELDDYESNQEDERNSVLKMSHTLQTSNGKSNENLQTSLS